MILANLAFETSWRVNNQVLTNMLTSTSGHAVDLRIQSKCARVILGLVDQLQAKTTCRTTGWVGGWGGVGWGGVGWGGVGWGGVGWGGVGWGGVGWGGVGWGGVGWGGVGWGGVGWGGVGWVGWDN